MKNIPGLPQCLLAASCLALGLPAVFAQGGPPMWTDDPGTPGDQHWEINVAWTVTHTAGGDQGMETPLLDINYGVGDNVQLKYEAPWLVEREAGSKAINGPGDSEIGVKWRFLDEDKNGVDISTYPQLTFNNPTSSQRRGLVEKGTSFLLPFEFHGRVGSLEWNAEFGREIHSRGEDEWLYGLAVGRELGDRFEFAVEIHGEGKLGTTDDELIANVGGRLKLDKNHTLLVSAGRSLNRLHGEEFNFIGYLGLQFTY
jgi:hypothetical protein